MGCLRLPIITTIYAKEPGHYFPYFHVANYIVYDRVQSVSNENDLYMNEFSSFGDTSTYACLFCGISFASFLFIHRKIISNR